MVSEARPTDEAIDNYLGTMKMLKPMRFKNPGAHWSDGFRQHGIFEVMAKRRGEDGKWRCTIRRIATFRPDCPLGEEHEFREEWLEHVMTTTDLLSFGV